MKRFLPSLLASALTCAAMESMAAADAVYFNGKVFTANTAQPLTQAVAVENGKILNVGTDIEMLALADGTTQRIDLAGKVLMPGMIDSHSHPIMGGAPACAPTCTTKFCRWLILSSGSSNRTKPASPAWAISW